jgi:Domain of unknown function (DUF4836)
MNKRIFSLAAVIAVLFFASCSKKSNMQGRYVPDNAAAVMHINGESLNSKLPWDEVKQNEWFKEMQADSSMSAFAKAALENPDNSGVDIKKDLLIFYVKDSAASYAAIEGNITDVAKFKQSLQDANKTGKETVKDGYTYYGDEKGTVAYNKEKFFALMETSGFNYALNPMAAYDTAATAPVKLDLAQAASKLIAMAEDKTLAKNEKFSALMAEKGDAHFWLNAQYFNSAASLGAMAAMANLSKLYEGAITTGTLNFDNGKINVDLKSYAGKELTALYKKYTGSGVDKTMLQNIPSANVAGVFAFNFKPEGIKEFLKLLNMDGLANLGAGQIGFNLDDFVKANKGDILFAVTDLKEDSTEGYSKPSMNFLFATSIGDKTSFNKLIDAGKKYGAVMAAATPPAVFNVNDKYFALSTDKASTEKFLAGASIAAPAYIDKVVGGPFGGFVNFQYILANIKTPKDSFDIQTKDLTAKMWDNMIINGGGFKDDAISQHWEINLMDKSVNSLKQLNKYIGSISAIEKKKSKQQDLFWKNDDIIAEPPVSVK